MIGFCLTGRATHKSKFNPCILSLSKRKTVAENDKLPPIRPHSHGAFQSMPPTGPCLQAWGCTGVFDWDAVAALTQLLLSTWHPCGRGHTSLNAHIWYWQQQLFLYNHCIPITSNETAGIGMHSTPVHLHVSKHGPAWLQAKMHHVNKALGSGRAVQISEQIVQNQILWQIKMRTYNYFMRLFACLLIWDHSLDIYKG